MFQVTGEQGPHQRIFWEGKDVGWSSSGHPPRCPLPPRPLLLLSLTLLLSERALVSRPSPPAGCSPVREAGRESGRAAIAQRRAWMVRHRHDGIPLGFPRGLPLPSAISADSRGPEHLQAVPASLRCPRRGGRRLQRPGNVLRDKSLTAGFDVMDSSHVVPPNAPFATL